MENFVFVCILLRSSVYGLLTFFSFLNLFFLPLRQVVKPSFNLVFNPLCWLVLLLTLLHKNCEEFSFLPQIFIER